MQRDSENFLKNKDQETQQLDIQLNFLETKLRDMVPKSAITDLKTTYNAHIAELTKRLDEEKERILDERAKLNTENSQLMSQLRAAEDQNSSSLIFMQQQR